MWEDGTAAIAVEQLRNSLTSREVKINAKDKNISGLQLADLIAHPLRSEFLNEHGLLDRSLAPYAAQIVAALEPKFCEEAGVIVSKRFIP